MYRQGSRNRLRHYTLIAKWFRYYFVCERTVKPCNCYNRSLQYENKSLAVIDAPIV